MPSSAPRTPPSPPLPYTTLFRSGALVPEQLLDDGLHDRAIGLDEGHHRRVLLDEPDGPRQHRIDSPAHLFGDKLRAGQIEPFLAVKVVLQRGRVHAGLRRNLAGGYALEAALAEQPQRDHDDAPAGLLAAGVSPCRSSPSARRRLHGLSSRSQAPTHRTPASAIR